MGGKLPSRKQRVQPGRAGMARQGESPALAYWLENMVIDDDGVYIPRAGTKHVKTFASGEINHLSRPGGYNARLMVIAESGKLYDLHTETASATLLGTGWPTGPMAACVGNVPGGATRWLACKAQIGSTAGPVFHYDGTTLTEITTTAPGDGNWVGMVMGAAMRVLSGVGTGDALQWSKVNDILTWDTLYQNPPPAGLTSVDAVVPFGPREAVLFGPDGLAWCRGVPPRNLAFELIERVEVATPMNHIAVGRGRIFFAGAGPRIYEFVPPGMLRPISDPLFRDLFLAQGTANIRSWYDSTADDYVFWDRTQKLGYCYNLRKEAWVGVRTYTDATKNMLGAAAIDQGASAFDAATQPWGKQFFAVDNMILAQDPSVYTDATSSSTTAAFTCKVEAQVQRDDPGYTRQLLSVQLHASGSWTPFYRHRMGPRDSWTTVTASSSLTCPDRWDVPLSSVEYRELVVGASASSGSGVRFHSFEIEEQISGRP